MGNSSYTLQALVDIARSMGDLAPTLPTGGAYETVATSAANDVMTAMVAGQFQGFPVQFQVEPHRHPTILHQLVAAGLCVLCREFGMAGILRRIQYVLHPISQAVRVIEVKRDILLVDQRRRPRWRRFSGCKMTRSTYGTWGLATYSA